MTIVWKAFSLMFEIVYEHRTKTTIIYMFGKLQLDPSVIVVTGL